MAPLDFDFAYEMDNFISTFEEDKENFGKYDESLFCSWINSETYELDKALQGEENMSNFAYTEGEPQEKSPLEIFFRDHMVRAYRTAILNPTPPTPRTPIQDVLIRLALALTDEANT